MDNTYAEIAKIVVALLGAVVTYYVIPFIKAKTTKEQREDAIFWTTMAVRIAEDIYKQKGQGSLKKDHVVEFLNKNGIKLSGEQMDFLIDAIVTEFNKNGWNIKISADVKVGE